MRGRRVRAESPAGVLAEGTPVSACFIPGCYAPGTPIRIGAREVHVCPEHIEDARETARNAVRAGVHTLGKIAVHRYPNAVAFLREMLAGVPDADR